MADEASFDEFYLATRHVTLGQLTAMTLDRELAADTGSLRHGVRRQRP